MVQISALSNAGPETGRDEDILAQQEMRDGRLQEDHEDPHHDRDVRRAWAGMLAAASKPVQATRGRAKTFATFSRDPDVQADFGAEWPVRKIADALNIIDPDPPWNDDRIENAKKRLRNWIGGMKRDHGLDQTGSHGLVRTVWPRGRIRRWQHSASGKRAWDGHPFRKGSSS